MFLIKEINAHSPNSTIQVEFSHSLILLRQKRQSLSQVPALQPLLWASWAGLDIKLWAGTSCELSLCQEFCAGPFMHVPVPPHTSSTLRAETSTGSVHNDKRKVRLCRSLCSQQIPKGRADPFQAGIPIPKPDVPDAAALSHHSTCLSPAAHTASPLREDTARTFLSPLTGLQRPKLLIPHLLLP